MGPICNDTVDYCATISCANSEPCVNIVKEMRGICLCGALKAPVYCSKGMAYSVCVCVCVSEMRGICLCGALKAPVTCSKGTAYSVCVCVCRDARDLSVWGPEGTGHLQQGYGI